ncbi:MAG: HlyD family type I secretion periplasmic adaptor subunit [Chitinophagaceae bacterium]|nr:HlyD family type I secretion periplasmic adaptor subunit [Rubrivivax sp.]
MNTATPPTSAAAPAGTANDVADAQEVSRLSDTRGPIRMGFWVLVVGFGLFLAWAAWAPLDEGVSATAVVSVESRRKTIQHMQGGVVRKVLVKEGTVVKQGDVLIELDDGVARATYTGIQQNYVAQRALEGRLLAEVAGASSISFHPDLLNSKDPVTAQHMAVQTQLFTARRAAHAADMAASAETIAGLERQLEGVREMASSRRAQQSLQTQQLAGVRALADEGFAPRNQALQLEQAQAELRTSLSDLDTTMNKLRSSATEQRLRLTQRRQEYAKEASGELATVRREVQANQEKLTAMTEELGRMQISAPSPGQVMALGVTGVGGVVQPGQHLMDILPLGDATLLDLKVPPHVIDRIKVGDEVEVRFSAFANTPHLVVLGKLISLSGDVVSEQMGGGVTSSYYLGRVQLTNEGLKALGDRVVQPGMVAEVLVKSGERSLLTYLMHPLLKRLAAAMTED